MRELLLAIQAELRAGLDNTVYRIGSNPDQGDVYISEAEQYLPLGCRLPAVGIKDGVETPVSRQACGEGYIEERVERTVNCVAWAPSLSAVVGAGLIGDATHPGVFGIKDDIHHILRDNLLSEDLGIQSVERGVIAPSVAVQYADGKFGQYLIIPYTYSVRTAHLIL